MRTRRPDEDEHRRDGEKPPWHIEDARVEPLRLEDGLVDQGCEAHPKPNRAKVSASFSAAREASGSRTTVDAGMRRS